MCDDAMMMRVCVRELSTHDVSHAHSRADDDNDHENTKEEEVYQELCSIHRSNGPQVIYTSLVVYLELVWFCILVANVA